MKINFHKQPAIDFVLRLTLTVIIISPVIYFSWDAVKGTSGSDYVESVVSILMAGFAMSVCYLFFSALEKFIDILNEENLPQEHHVMVLAVLADISLHTDRFLINSSELVQMAAQYSPAFQKLPADRQAFISSVLSMPLFLIM